MPRRARIVWPGELHHVIQRGNYRRNIFFEDQDRAVYLKYMNENSQQYGLKVYAFCLMDNHVHFIVKPEAWDSLAKTFCVTHQRYALYLNKRLKEHGHRWQSRYYSCVVLGTHIARAVRYVESNPVRAGMAKTPWAHPWSSARAHLGKPYRIIKLADISEYIQVASWKKYLLMKEEEDMLKYLRESALQGRVFGPLTVIQKLQKNLKQKLLPCARGRPRKKE